MDFALKFLSKVSLIFKSFAVLLVFDFCENIRLLWEHILLNNSWTLGVEDSFSRYTRRSPHLLQLEIIYQTIIYIDRYQVTQWHNRDGLLYIFSYSMRKYLVTQTYLVNYHPNYRTYIYPEKLMCLAERWKHIQIGIN